MDPQHKSPPADVAVLPPPKKARKVDGLSKPQSLPAIPNSSPAPSQTLYIQNLNDKIRKEELRTTLYMLFSPYGQVLSIVAMKTPKMRGQAHVAFANVASASSALRALQGFNVYGKDLKLAFAKTKSDAIAKLEGTYRMPVPRPMAQSTLPLAPFEQQQQQQIGGIKRTREDESASSDADSDY